MKAAFGGFCIIYALSLFSTTTQAYEMVGQISYNITHLNPKPSSYRDSSNGIGYTFLGRVDWGPGQLESGFQFVPTSITTTHPGGEIKTTGSFWIIPLVYRYYFFSFLSAGVGVDYAVMGTSNLAVTGTPLTTVNSGYLSHFGAQASVAGQYGLGENLSLVLDTRFRMGLGNAISYSNVGTLYDFIVVGLGIQKHLE